MRIDDALRSALCREIASAVVVQPDDWRQVADHLPCGKFASALLLECPGICSPFLLNERARVRGLFTTIQIKTTLPISAAYCVSLEDGHI
jgi:hypothetical protein